LFPLFRTIHCPAVRALSEKTLILSDLHLGHTASRAEAILDMLAGAVQPFDRVVINGDAVNCLDDEAGRAAAQPLLKRLDDVLTARNGPPFYITGNHDPAISETHHLYFEESGLLAFHGDFAGDNPAPWEPHAVEFVLRVREEVARRGSPVSFAERAVLFRRLQRELKVERYELRERTSRVAYVLRQLIPPTRPFVVLKYVLQAPARAAELALTFERPVRHVAFGHVHRPGRWMRGQLAVYNTGSFMPFSAPWALSVEGASVRFLPLSRVLEERRSVHAPGLVGNAAR